MEKQQNLPDRTKRTQAPGILPVMFKPRLGDWRTWANIALLFLVLEIAVYSIEQAQWITPQPSLTLVLFLSVLTVWLLTLSRLPGVIIHILAPVIGILVTIWQVLNLLPGTTSSLNHLLQILQSWWQASGALMPGEEKIPFAIFLTFLTWVVGYISTWFIIRRHNAWVAVALGTVVILVNLSNLAHKYYFFFLIYFLAAVVLIIQTRVVGQQSLIGRKTGHNVRSLFYLIASLMCITVLAAGVSWVIPEVRFSGLQNIISTKMPWKRDIQGSKINIFNAVPSKQALSTTSTLRDLAFGTSWNQGDEIKFTVEADRPSYWQMNVYDTYTAQGWANSPTSERLLENEEPWADTGSLADRPLMTYKVTTDINTDILLIAGDFVSSDTPAIVHVGAGEDVTAVTTPRILAPGEHYVVRSWLSDPIESNLSGAGESYPESIKAVYLQLPSDFPADIKQLSENITGEAKTPYAKVMAIVDYLSGFSYNQVVGTPLAGTDGVEYFLFTQKSGFCLHFASAMAVMLRSVDVPARLAVGYLPGDPGEKRGQYLLRDKHYHAWTQVYFPGYGWVDFEATPSSPGSEVIVQTPLVSTPAIRESPQWNVWLYPPSYLNEMGVGLTGDLPEGTGFRKPSGPLPYAGALGRALLIIFGGGCIVALLFGLFLIIKTFFYRRLWHVDRNNLAYGTYNNVCKLAALAKLGPLPQQTPLEFAGEMAAAFPQEAEAMGNIVRAYVENRFGRREGKPGLYEEAEILKARHIVYDSLIKRLGFAGKLLNRA